MPLMLSNFKLTGSEDINKCESGNQVKHNKTWFYTHVGHIISDQTFSPVTMLKNS